MEYRLILLDDSRISYAYVLNSITEVLRCSTRKAKLLVDRAQNNGSVVLFEGQKERAEFLSEQLRTRGLNTIHARKRDKQEQKDISDFLKTS